MAIAATNLTGRNTMISGTPRKDILSLWPQWSTTVPTNYYAGGAMLARLFAGALGTDQDCVGSADRTFTGLVKGLFAGVNIEDVTVPAFAGTTHATGPDFFRYQVKCAQQGTFRFNPVTGGGWTPDYSDIGRTVWFHSDNEVFLSPPAGDGVYYPIPAGIIRNIVGSQVEVDITRHANVEPRVLYYGPFRTNAMPAAQTDVILEGAAAGTATSWMPGRRLWITRLFAKVITQFAGPVDQTVEVHLNNAGGDAAPLLLTIPTAATADQVVSGRDAASLAKGICLTDITDTIGLYINATTAANWTAGLANIWIEAYPLDQ